MRYVFLGFVLGFLIGAVLKGYGDTRRFSVEVIDLDSGLPNLKLAARAGVRTLSRKLPIHARLRKITRRADDAPEDLVTTRRVAWYESRIGSRGRNWLTMVFFNSRHKNDYGLARICSTGNRVGYGAVTRETPLLRAKFFIAHELGHALGSYHAQPLLPQFEDVPRATIMFPYWDTYFELLKYDRARWGYARSSRIQIDQCLKVFGTEPDSGFIFCGGEHDEV